jgi:hypothetical protein
VKENPVNTTSDVEQKESKKRFSGLQVLGIVAAVVVLTVAVTMAVAWSYLFPRPFKPVVLTPAEQVLLEAKLDRVEAVTGIQPPGTDIPAKAKEAEPDLTPDGRLQPRAYTEEDADREVSFSERELNALIATNTDLADKFAVDLADNLVSARLLVPVDPDFPVFGGKILRVRAGVEVAYREGRPVVKLRGVSLMGVPVPNAWLGGLKNIDLVQEFGADRGFWKAFADGVEAIAVEEGRIHVTMKE